MGPGTNKLPLKFSDTRIRSNGKHRRHRGRSSFYATKSSSSACSCPNVLMCIPYKLIYLKVIRMMENTETFFTETTRLGSFSTWPHTGNRGPITLARAGFYCLKGGTNEMTISCPWCSVKVHIGTTLRKDWDPISSHRVHCRFLSGDCDNVPISAPGAGQEREVKRHLRSLVERLLIGGNACATEIATARDLNDNGPEVEEPEISLNRSVRASLRGGHPQQGEERGLPHIEICLATGEISQNFQYGRMICLVYRD